MKKILIISFLFSLSGCATVYKVNDSILNQGSRYKEPASGKTANVRVFYGIGKKIYIYPNSQTKKELSKDKDGGLAFTSVKTLGFQKFEYAPNSLNMPYAPQSATNFGEFKVPADRPVIVQMTYGYKEGQRYESCPFRMFKVTFEESKDYALIMNTNSGCTYEFYEYKNGQALRMKNIEKL